MLDPLVRRIVDGPLLRTARHLVALGIDADRLTWLGFGFGMTAALAIALGAPWLAVLFFGLNRLCDGLDGAVARLKGPTDRGAFLDIVLDFLSYGSIPLAFAINDPAMNALPAAVLLFSFIGTATTFLAYAILAAKRGLSTELRGKKGFYYLGGLAEGTETVLVFLLMAVFPSWFSVLAYGFAVVCLLTAATRIHAGIEAFDGVPNGGQNAGLEVGPDRSVRQSAE